jgi:hypothetical protein
MVWSMDEAWDLPHESVEFFLTSVRDLGYLHGPLLFAYPVSSLTVSSSVNAVVRGGNAVNDVPPKDLWVDAIGRAP